jgi:hypothetical protein
MGQIAGAAEEEAPVSECSESAQSSSLGHENKITPNQSEFALVLQQLNEFKEDMCSMREDFENFKVYLHSLFQISDMPFIEIHAHRSLCCNRTKQAPKMASYVKVYRKRDSEQSDLKSK